MYYKHKDTTFFRNTDTQTAVISITGIQKREALQSQCLPCESVKVMISPFKKEVFSFGILYIVYIFAVRLFFYGHTHIERKI